MTLRSGAMILAYDQEDYIHYCLRALYPLVDCVQIMYSASPFTAYNERARDEFCTPDRTLDILLGFPDPDQKLRVHSGVWNDEESMRTDAASLLRKEQIDLCLIIDADEFWPDGMLSRFLDHIATELGPGEVGWVNYRTPFKRVDRRIDFPNARLPVAVLLDSPAVFVNRRIPAGAKRKISTEFFFWHMGYVLSDERMYKKIKTFSHAHEVPKTWFSEKWLRFSDDTIDLCRRDPKRWPRTVPMDPNTLPDVLQEHPYVLQVKRQLGS